MIMSGARIIGFPHGREKREIWDKIVREKSGIFFHCKVSEQCFQMACQYNKLRPINYSEQLIIYSEYYFLGLYYFREKSGLFKKKSCGNRVLITLLEWHMARSCYLSILEWHMVWSCSLIFKITQVFKATGDSWTFVLNILSVHLHNKLNDFINNNKYIILNIFYRTKIVWPAVARWRHKSGGNPVSGFHIQ